MEQKFYICEQCGSIISMVKNSGVPVVCCGRKMTEIIPGSVDASAEKHLPVYQIEKEKVWIVVGETEHPMTEEHYIEWILLQTRQGIQMRQLKPTDAPKGCFAVSEGDAIEAVYAYCNLHGLWKV